MAIMILLGRFHRVLSVLLLLLRLIESNENAVEVGEGSVFESREWDGKEVWDERRFE